MENWERVWTETSEYYPSIRLERMRTSLNSQPGRASAPQIWGLDLSKTTLHHYSYTNMASTTPYHLQTLHNIVTCIPFGRKRLGKHIPAEANARKNRTFIARQRISKHSSLTVEAEFSAWSMQSGYIKEFSWRKFIWVELLSGIGSSSGDGSPRWLRRIISHPYTWKYLLMRGNELEKIWKRSVVACTKVLASSSRNEGKLWNCQE
jgi:hypothetical protein